MFNRPMECGVNGNGANTRNSLVTNFYQILKTIVSGFLRKSTNTASSEFDIVESGGNYILLCLRSDRKSEQI